MTRFEVYKVVAECLATERFESDVREVCEADHGDGEYLTKEDQRQITAGILEVINALNFCIRYNWPISTYFRERKQHDAAD